MIEQQNVLASMPVKEGFGFEHTPATTGTPASTSKAKAFSPVASTSAAKGKAKRRKTPEYTDSEDDDS